MKQYRKIDIYRKAQFGQKDFSYFCSTTRARTCSDAIKLLPVSPRYFFTRNRKDYFHNTEFIYVAYISKP